jgi:hypothetical protein
MIRFVFDFTLHFLYLTRMRNIQDTATKALDRYDDCTPETKATAASVQAVGVSF